MNYTLLNSNTSPSCMHLPVCLCFFIFTDCLRYVLLKFIGTILKLKLKSNEIGQSSYIYLTGKKTCTIDANCAVIDNRKKTKFL